MERKRGVGWPRTKHLRRGRCGGNRFWKHGNGLTAARRRRNGFEQKGAGPCQSSSEWYNLRAYVRIKALGWRTTGRGLTWPIDGCCSALGRLDAMPRRWAVNFVEIACAGSPPDPRPQRGSPYGTSRGKTTIAFPPPPLAPTGSGAATKLPAPRKQPRDEFDFGAKENG